MYLVTSCTAHSRNAPGQHLDNSLPVRLPPLPGCSPCHFISFPLHGVQMACFRASTMVSRPILRTCRTCSGEPGQSGSNESLCESSPAVSPYLSCSNYCITAAVMLIEARLTCHVHLWFERENWLLSFYRIRPLCKSFLCCALARLPACPTACLRHRESLKPLSFSLFRAVAPLLFLGNLLPCMTSLTFSPPCVSNGMTWHGVKLCATAGDWRKLGGESSRSRVG